MSSQLTTQTIIAPPSAGVFRIPQRVYRKKTLEERYWSKVDQAPGQGPWGDCWGWKGSTKGGGYGMLGDFQKWSDGTSSHIPIMAHVFSYELHIGPIPEGLEVSHDCDNPPCTKPHHLIAETHLENMSSGNGRRREAELAEISDSISWLPDVADNAVMQSVFNRRYLEQGLAQLSARWQRIIALRFGLEDGVEQTLEEISGEFGVSRERIRQIEEKALERLRRFYAGHLMK
jgi:RNA polymerase sigma factor (sigma-70 family)